MRSRPQASGQISVFETAFIFFLSAHRNRSPEWYLGIQRNCELVQTIETGLLRSVQPAARIRVYGACCSRCCFLAAEGSSLFIDLLSFRGSSARVRKYHPRGISLLVTNASKSDWVNFAFRNFLEEKKKTFVYRLLLLHSYLNSLRKNFAEAIACCQNKISRTVFKETFSVNNFLGFWALKTLLLTIIICYLLK